MIVNIGFVALGGVIGAMGRHVLIGQLARFSLNGFPLGTFFVNSLGCFFIGLLWSIWGEQAHPVIKWGLIVGCLGSFTTFSTFGLDIVRLLMNGQVGMSIFYLLLTNLLGIGLVVLGYYLPKLT